MKRTLLFCLTVLLALPLCACLPAESGAQYTATKNGVDYMVDWENGTISDGTYTYHFTYSGNGSGYSLEITYPDGSTYSWNQQTSNGWGFGSGGGSEDYDADRYVDGHVLCEILEAGAPRAKKEANSGQVLLGILLVGVGLVNVIAPHIGWHLSEGWKFKDAEPSEMALGLGRMGGGFAIFLGIIVLLAALLG